MKRCTYCGRENEDDAVACRECATEFADAGVAARAEDFRPHVTAWARSFFCDVARDVKRRWLLGSLGLVVLAAAFGLVLSRESPNANAPGIILLASYFSNGEQVVTFRPDPTNAQIMSAELVSVSEDGRTQPATFRSFGVVHPVRSANQTNFSLHFTAVPSPGASMGGRPLAYTPGSYTVAYTPTETAHRVRVGVAVQQHGMSDYLGRLRRCWERKSFDTLWWKAHRDPFFVTTEPFTNAALANR